MVIIYYVYLFKLKIMKITTREMIATPFRNDGPNITIPKGSEIIVLKHPYENQPNSSEIEYKGNKFSVVRSILDLAVGGQK
jgi:hypothetical protein